MIVRSIICVFGLLLYCGELAGQSTPEPKIQDNSFLLEEAYNQEAGVVQHIFNFTHLFESDEWVATFTQEWPVKSQRHQFSYTLVGTSISGFANSSPGFGDIAINYRLQAVGSGETRLAIAPRVSLLLPTGNELFGRGYGGTGIQFNLPVSYELLPKLVAHWNAGTTLVPNAKNEFGQKASVTGYNAAQGLIWLARPNFNVMLETVWNNSENVIAADRTERFNDILISPGVRWAHNFKSGLQVVPGIAVPIGVGPTSGEKGILFYLSLEHPFRRLAE
jgi:hypothetical protein